MSQIKLGKGAGAMLAAAFSSYLTAGTTDRGITVRDAPTPTKTTKMKRAPATPTTTTKTTKAAAGSRQTPIAKKGRAASGCAKQRSKK